MRKHKPGVTSLFDDGHLLVGQCLHMCCTKWNCINSEIKKTSRFLMLCLVCLDIWFAKEILVQFWEKSVGSSDKRLIVRRAGLLWSQQDFEWRWSVPLFKCLTVLEFSFILFDLCLLITFFNFIMNYVPIVTFWIFTYHKIWILSIMFCFIWSYWIIFF